MLPPALSGAHLAHRLSADIDLFCHDREEMRRLVAELPAIVAELAGSLDELRAYRDELAARFRALATAE